LKEKIEIEKELDGAKIEVYRLQKVTDYKNRILFSEIVIVIVLITMKVEFDYFDFFQFYF